MILFDRFTKIFKVPWVQLRPGMVIIGGFTVDGSLPPPLHKYPVLNSSMIEALNRNLKIKPRILSVIDAYEVSGDPLPNFSDEMKMLQSTRTLVKDHLAERRKILASLGCHDLPGKPVFTLPGLSDLSGLIINRFSSFMFPGSDDQDIPSVFKMPGSDLSLEELIAREALTGIKLPANDRTMLHIGVDLSYSMSDKVQFACHALNGIHNFIKACFTLTQCLVYGFAEECRTIVPPVGDLYVEKKETRYSAFFKKVLHNRDSTVPNRIILVTDGRPTEYPDAVKIMGNFRKQKIDYTQIVLKNVLDTYVLGPGLNILDGVALNAPDDSVRQYTDDEKKGIETEERSLFTSLADQAHGNQILLSYNEILKLVLTEYWDYTLGLKAVAGNTK